MTLATSTFRALGALSAGLLTLGMLSACTPTPEPDPKPTKTALFASDEEAFKAAEETYRAYNDAGNAKRRDGSNDPQDFLTGQALRGYISGQRALEDAGIKVDGDIQLTSFAGNPSSVKRGGEKLNAIVCLDLSHSTARYGSGQEVPNRPKMIAQEVEMTWIDGSYLISGEYDTEQSQCAG